MTAPAQAIPEYSWSKELAKGRVGLVELVRLLRATGHRVVDLVDVGDAQRRDIDLLVDDELVEVKSDFHRPVNAYLELTSNDKPGCVFQSRADYWLYYFPTARRCFKLSTSRLQWFFALKHGEYYHLVTRSRSRESTWLATGVVVPLADLIAAGVAEEVSLGDDLDR